MTLDPISTLAFAGAILWLGGLLGNQTPCLSRHNVPPPVLSGLLFASLAWWWWRRSGEALIVDSSSRLHLQSLFFATIGLNSTVLIARRAGLRAVKLWAIAGVIAIAQNLVGIGLALAIGAPAVLGLACGSASLMGGAATGRACAAQLETAGLAGAREICIAAAAFGLIAASLLGNPVATFLIRQPGEPAAPAKASIATAPIVRHLLILACLAAAGAFGSKWLTGLLPVLVPSYVVALALGLVVRYLDDRWRWLTLDGPTLVRLSAILSSLFLAHAMMDLRREQLAALTWPVLGILVVEIAVTVASVVLLVRWRLGSNYEAAVSTAGLIGFSLGITPNVVANMTVLGRIGDPIFLDTKLAY